jgi:ABC-type multidrug transport system fused ATPase/permease subunit
MNPATLPNRLWPFSFHFYRQFRWGVLGLVVFPVLSRGVFASIAYATKRLTDTVLAMHDPAQEAGKVLAPFLFFVGLVVLRFVMDAGAWFSSYNTRSPMLRRIKEEVFAYTQRLSSSYFREHAFGEDRASGDHAA